MSTLQIRLLTLSALFVSLFAYGEETTVVPTVTGPEGPLYVDGYLYYVSSTDNTLYRWDGSRSTVVNMTPGCGHNGLAFTPRQTFLVACLDHGAIMELDKAGKIMRHWDKDSHNRAFTGGVNDVVVAADGGAYATIFGNQPDNVSPPGDVVGRILYLPPHGKQWITVAENLNYANGIGISPDQKTLYVDEMVGNCILKFAIKPNGSLAERSNFALLSHLVSDKVNTPWIGPDSMKVDAAGHLYVAQWSGGKVVKLAPDGRLLHVFNIDAGDGTTNVAFGPGERELYVTVVERLDDPKYRGRIVKISNVADQ